MADNRPTDEREHDQRILVAMIVDIREQLWFIVFERRDLFRNEFRQYFSGPWNDIQTRLLRAEHALEQPDFNWEYLEGAGLVRDSLQFKRNMFSRESVTHSKEVTALDRPYVKRAALVGADSLPN